MANTPNTENYTLGKGVVSFNKLNRATGLYFGERDLGNAPAFAVSVAIEKLQHYSSRSGLKAKDKEVISQLTPSFTFTLDEINIDNLAMLTLGSVEEVVQAAGSVADELVVAHPGMMAQLSKRQIGLTTLAHGTVTSGPFVVGQTVTGGTSTATGVIKVVGSGYIQVAATGVFQNNETITSGSVSASTTAAPVFVSGITSVKSEDGTTTYDVTDDYDMSVSLKDNVIGRIRFPEDSSIPDGTTVKVTYSHAAVTYKIIRAFKETQINGMLRFVSDNATGGNRELKAWTVSLTPTGDTAMIGDDWAQMAFACEVLKDEVGHPDSPYVDIIEL